MGINGNRQHQHQEAHVASNTHMGSTRTRSPILERPIFVGGVSRSGTTVVGKALLGRHHDIACTVPAEMWFITDTGGVCDLVAAESNWATACKNYANAARLRKLTPKAAFRVQIQGVWYERDWWKDGRKKGLFQSVSREQLDTALEDFEDSYIDGPRDAARRLIADLIDPSVRERGGSRWVDTTPDSARNAHGLYALYPDMKMINMERDGRDVAASIVARPWGTDSYDAALKQWFRGRQQIARSIRQVPPDTVLTVQLEDLLTKDRDGSYEQILNHLDIDDSPKMRSFFTKRMSAEAGNVGRWRTDVSVDELRRIDGRFQRMTDELEATIHTR